MTDEEMDKMEIECCLWDSGRIAALIAEVRRLQTTIREMELDDRY